MDSSSGNVSSFSNMLSEGENVSFIYNATKIESKCTVSNHKNSKKKKVNLNCTCFFFNFIYYNFD